MGGKQKVFKSQLGAADQVLERLRKAVSPEYLGLISTTGQPISVILSSKSTDSDALAALTAGSFAAARQLARTLEDSKLTIMLHESTSFNIQIAQVTDDILLIICFRGSGDIGRVRLITKQAVIALAKAFNHGGQTGGTD
jgi:predicted regulator of Ras-like GTPase activity (Roadblock/LC7/MglB family)